MRSGKAGQREEAGDVSLAPAMDRSRRRTHQEVAVLIGFDTIWEFGESGISQHFGPARGIVPGLRIQIWQLDSDRHDLRLRQKKENEDLALFPPARIKARRCA